LLSFLKIVDHNITELELLNSECQDHTSRECSLDAIAARNVLKVAIASRVVLEESTEECVYDIGDDIGDDNPYSSFNEMDDLCNDDMHAIPTAAMRDTDLERIIQCAEEGKCPVGEMAEMIDGTYYTAACAPACTVVHSHL
jgi:hypothetical protein